MSDTVSIPARTYNSIERNIEQNQRMMNRIRIMLERQQLEELISEVEAAEFLEIGIDRLRNMVYDGSIPQDAYVKTINNTRKYYKQKLIKR